MKSKIGKACLALLAALGFNQTTTSCGPTPEVMYGPVPSYPQDSMGTVRPMYGVPVTNFEKTDLTTPKECPEAEPETEPQTEE